MQVYKTIIKEALPILILCSFGGIIAGSIFKNISVYISVLPGILVLAPAVMSLTDAILGTFNSRITSAVHSGKIDMNSFSNPILRENILGVFTITIIISIILGIVAHFACLLFGYTSMGIPKFVLIAFLTHIFSYVFMILISIFLIFLAVKAGKDPDDIVSPLSPVISDMASMFFLLLTVKLITFM